MASPYEHDDSAAKKHHQAHQVRLMDYSVQPGDENISTIARKLITEQTHSATVTPQQMREFMDNVAKHNAKLKTKEQRDHIHQGDEIWLEMPILGALKAARPNPAVHEVKTKTGNAAVSQPVAKTTPVEHRPLPAGQVCSAAELKQVGDWVTQNEVGAKASPLTYNPNDHGHGVSVGLMQWNQKRGKLPELLKAFHDSDPRKFDLIFASNAQNVLNVQFVKQADFTTGALNRSLLSALPAFQSVQYQLRDHQVELGCEAAYKHHFTALRGVGVSADLVNHLGEVKTEKVIHRVPAGLTESKRIDILEALGEKFGVRRMASIDSSDRELWSIKK